MHSYVMVPVHATLLIGSFGAMSVNIFSSWASPLAQPKNAVLGNTLGGLVGVCAGSPEGVSVNSTGEKRRKGRLLPLMKLQNILNMLDARQCF